MAAEGTIYTCEVCFLRISYERVIIAQSRGKRPKYCCTMCRRTAAKRRERAGAAVAAATAASTPG